MMRMFVHQAMNDENDLLSTSENVQKMQEAVIGPKKLKTENKEIRPTTASIT